jgi:predicted amidohydrolase YtcJ
LQVAQLVASMTDFEAAIVAGARHCIKLGITSLTESGLTAPQLDVYRKLAADRHLPLRVNAIALRYDGDGKKIPLPERFESNWLRIDSIRLYAEDSNGLRVNDEQMRAMVWDIHRAGLRAVIQAASEAAIEQAIAAIEYASQRLVSRLKHRIEPFEHPTDAHIRRCHEHGITVVVQPGHNDALLRKLLDSGVTVGLGSGAPEREADPLLVLKSTSQHLSIADALSVYTHGSAAVAGEDQLKGTVAAGKYADFAVLSGDPFRAPAERLTDLQVEMTIINGQVVYSS